MDCVGRVLLFIRNCFQANSGEASGTASASNFSHPSQDAFSTMTKSQWTTKPICARNEAVMMKNSPLVLAPKPNGLLNGDWIMRHTDGETNFHPWNYDNKFGHFELVPWRQKKSCVDIVNSTGWEPPTCSEKSVKKLQKFEIRRARQRLKRNVKYVRRSQKNVKIKVMISIELRQRKFEVFMPQFEKRNFDFNNPRACLALQTQSINDHWGYFSQRDKGVDEYLTCDSNLKAIAWTNSDRQGEANKLGETLLNESSVRTLNFTKKQVPCELCLR